MPVPLGGAEQALGMELPEIAGELPVPTPGAPQGPRWAEGRLLPERTLPRLPLSGGLPGADVRRSLPRIGGDGFDHVGPDAPASGLRALAPGLSAHAPLGAPRAGACGLPTARLLRAGVPAPLVRTVPTAGLGTGPGL